MEAGTSGNIIREMKAHTLLELASEFTDEYVMHPQIVEALELKELSAVAYIRDSPEYVRELLDKFSSFHQAVFEQPLTFDLDREDPSIAIAINDKKGATQVFLVLDILWSDDEDQRIGAKILRLGSRSPESNSLDSLLFNVAEIFLGCFAIDAHFDKDHDLSVLMGQLGSDEPHMHLVAICAADSPKLLTDTLHRSGFFAKADANWSQEKDQVIFERQLVLLSPEEPESDESEAF